MLIPNYSCDNLTLVGRESEMQLHKPFATVTPTLDGDVLDVPCERR